MGKIESLNIIFFLLLRRPIMFTVAYLFLDFLLQRREHQRRMQYLERIREYVSRGSVAFRHFPKMASTLQLGRRKFSLLCDDCATPTKEKILAQYLGRRMLAVTPKQKVNLKDWTLFMSQHVNSILNVQGISDKLFALLEAQRPENQEAFMKKWFSLPAHKRIKMKDYCVPIAWKPGTVFGIIVASSLEDFSLMGCAFLEGHLELEDGLEVYKLTSIDIEGTASDLLEVSQFLKPGKKSNGLSEILSKAEFLFSQSKQMEAMAENSIDLQDLEFSQTALPQFSSDLTHNINSSNESLAGSTWPPDMDGDGFSENSQNSNEDQANMATSSDWDKSPNTGLPSTECQELPDLVNSNDQNIINKSMKPPNILIYCSTDSDQAVFEYLKTILNCCLHRDSYVIYPLLSSQIKTVPWWDNVVLVILLPCKIASEDKEIFVNYVCSGGKLLSLCSDLDFSFITLNECITSWISIAYKSLDMITLKPGPYSYSINENTSDEYKINVLCAETQNENPVLVQITNEKKGVAVLSQIHLESKDGIHNTAAENVKLEILQDLLSTHFHLDCSPSAEYQLTPCFLMTQHEDHKKLFINSISPKVKDGALVSKNLTFHFVKLTDKYPPISPELLPIIILDSFSQEARFNAVQYFQNLKTKCLGQLLFFIEVVPTTMTVIDSLLPLVPSTVGAIVVANQQTKGRGRSGNSWLSPGGCAMFSFNGQFPLMSNLGQKLPFLQHLATLAGIQAVRTIPGYEDINLRLKWPNDLYYGSDIKIGGNLVNASTLNNLVNFVVGIGLNTNNSFPTTCINDAIRQYNIDHGTHLQSLTCEFVIANTLTHFEDLLTKFQNGHEDEILQLYYNVWLHSDAVVTLGENSEHQVTIIGLDSDGFLLVEGQDGQRLSLQPDGNSFDMLRNLIIIKTL